MPYPTALSARVSARVCASSGVEIAHWLLLQSRTSGASITAAKFAPSWNEPSEVAPSPKRTSERCNSRRSDSSSPSTSRSGTPSPSPITRRSSCSAGTTWAISVSVCRDLRRLSRTLSGTWPFVLAVWLGSRIFFFAVGAIGHAYVGFAQPGGSPREPPGFLDYWAHWDGGWYAAIAEHGYFDRPSTSFFPLYPILVRFADHLPGGTAFWGVAVSVACLLAALYFLYEIAEELFDARVARAAILAFAFFPSAFFMNAVYSESVFLAATAATVWALRVRRHFLLACLFAYFAMATRNVGIFLLVPLLWELVGRRRTRLREGALGLVGSLGGLVAYMLYLAKGLGDPLYFAVAQRETWGRALTNPINTLHIVQ